MHSRTRDYCLIKIHYVPKKNPLFAFNNNQCASLKKKKINVLMWICLNVVETKESVDLLNSLLIFFFLSRENNKKLSIPQK